ncbi:glycosyltransferase [Rhodococcus hoagii]|nr:glycosyltransferase [Prescottella equi]
MSLERMMPERSILVFAPTTEGGHPEYVAKLLSGAVESRDGFGVVWPSAEPSTMPVPYDRRRIQRIGARFPKIRDKETMPRWKWVLERVSPLKRYDIAFVRWILRQPRRFDAIVIEEFQRYTLPLVILACRRKSDRVSLHLHNLRRHDYCGSVLDRIDEWTLFLGIRLCKSVVVHADSIGRGLIERNPGSCTDVFVVRHGVQAARSEVVLPEGTPKVLFFGINRRNKGLSVLVDALELLSDEVYLHVVGATPDDYRAETTEILQRVDSLEWSDGFVDPDQARSHFDSASVVVLPYTGFEAQSGVLHMAIEHGVPVVVTDVGALGETVREHGLGIVVPPSDPVALAKAIRQILLPVENEKYRKNAIRAQQELSWATVGGDFVDAVLSNSGSRVDLKEVTSK